MTLYPVTPRENDGSATVVRKASLRRKDLASWLSNTYSTIYAFLATNGRHPTGAPFAVYHRRGVDRYEVEAGFPVDSRVEGSAELENSALPRASVATTTHDGRLGDTDDAYRAIASWLDASKAKPTGAPWEVYLTDPQLLTDPATWRTEINQPYRLVGDH
jgi:effector-binding domain-containing protein